MVTDNAKRKWIKFIKDTAKKLPDNHKMYVSGCGAFTDGKAQNDFFEVYPQLNYLKDKVEV